MLDEPELRRLAEDIGANGLIHPIVLDPDGRILDGRNRYAACQLAGTEPTFTTYDGDPVARILSANNERRHLTLPQRAAAVALTLAADGQRIRGRWKRGTVPKPVDRPISNAWEVAMKRAGVVLDY